MQLLDRLDTRSWLVAGVLVVGGLAAALWPRGASTDDDDDDDDDTVCRCIPAAQVELFDNLVMLHRAMQRRDALPDQIVPQCSTATLASDERARNAADMKMFACDAKGCQPVASLAANQRVQHCDDGLPQQFLEWRPHAAATLGAQASLVRARNTTDDTFLVFVPADRYRATATYRPPAWRSWHNHNITVAGTYVAQQTRYDLAADFAKPPAGYFLLGAELSTETTVKNNAVKLALSGSNLLGARYRDYTSLLRYFVDQPTWQLALRLSIHFGKSE